MAISLLSNISSFSVQRELGKAESSLSSSFQKLSSGLRINKASDDAASLGIAAKLNLESRIKAAGVRNINDTISQLNIAESALSSLSDIVERQKELANQAANGVLTSEQRSSLSQENTALMGEYARILESTEYNGRSLLTAGQGESITQAGDDFLTLDYLSNASVAEGIGTYTTTNVTVASAEVYTAEGVLVGDVNGDGIDDLVTAQVRGGTLDLNPELYMTTILGNGDGTFATNSTALTTASLSNGLEGISNLRLEFLGGDTQTIALSVDMDDSGVSEYRFEGSINTDGKFDGLSAGGPPSTTSAQTSVTGDFNGDGVEDTASMGNKFITINVQDTTLTQSFVDLSQDTISLDSASSARSALVTLDQLSVTLQNSQGQLGGSLVRLEAALSVTRSNQLESDQALSSIQDVDVASEVAGLTSSSVRRQIGTAVLAQANQQTQVVLSLLSQAN